MAQSKATPMRSTNRFYGGSSSRGSADTRNLSSVDTQYDNSDLRSSDILGYASVTNPSQSDFWSPGQSIPTRHRSVIPFSTATPVTTPTNSLDFDDTPRSEPSMISLRQIAESQKNIEAMFTSIVDRLVSLEHKISKDSSTSSSSASCAERETSRLPSDLSVS